MLGSLYMGLRTTANFPGDNVMVGILSQLEMCTAIVAGCSITYRPLIEKVFRTGNTSKGTTGASANSRQGWSKINVRHDIIMSSVSPKPHSGRELDEEELRTDWEMQTKGIDSNWK